MPVTAQYDQFVRTDGDELWDRLHQAHRRFAGLLSVTPGKHPVPGSAWTAGEIAGHLLTVLRRRTLAPDLPGLADLNAREVSGLGSMSVAEINDQIWQELAELEHTYPRTADLHQQLAFHGGQQVDLAGWLGNLIGEFTLHGRDVARSRGKAWKVGSRNAALALNMGFQALPGFLSPDLRGDLSLEVRTPESTPWVLDLRGGALESRRAERRERVDVRVYARTEPLLLNRYGRIGMAALTARGAVVVGGRRPWRLVRMPASFLTP